MKKQLFYRRVGVNKDLLTRFFCSIKIEIESRAISSLIPTAPSPKNHQQKVSPEAFFFSVKVIELK